MGPNKQSMNNIRQKALQSGKGIRPAVLWIYPDEGYICMPLKLEARANKAVLPKNLQTSLLWQGYCCLFELRCGIWQRVQEADQTYNTSKQPAADHDLRI